MKAFFTATAQASNSFNTLFLNQQRKVNVMSKVVPLFPPKKQPEPVEPMRRAA